MVIVHHIERVFFDIPAYATEVSERAADADELRIGIDFLEPFDPVKMFFDEILNFFRLFFGRTIIVFEKVGKRNRAERQRFAGKDILAAVVNELRAAAADVHNKPFGHFQTVDDALINKVCLLVLCQNLNFDTARNRDFVKKTFLVFGAAYGGSCVSVNLFNAVRVAKTAEHFKRFYRLRDALRLQKAVPVHILPEAYGFLQFVENDKISAFENVDEYETRGI